LFRWRWACSSVKLAVLSRCKTYTIRMQFHVQELLNL
jgi:hypothetical protein